MEYDFKDYKGRNRSSIYKKLLINYLEFVWVLCQVVGALFILALVGSLIWGNEGFVELLASFF